MSVVISGHNHLSSTTPGWLFADDALDAGHELLWHQRGGAEGPSLELAECMDDGMVVVCCCVVICCKIISVLGD